MDWGTLLLAVGLVYLAYEAGRWSQREDIKKQAEIHVMIMKAFEKAQQDHHYQSIVDKNEEMEKNKQDYNMESEQLWNEIEEAEIEVETESEPEVEAEVEAEVPVIDEIDDIKPHSMVTDETIITPDDAVVVSPSGPLTTRKP